MFALTMGFMAADNRMWRGVFMAEGGTGRGWEEQVREAAERVEGELRRVVTYINDEVVPDVRKNGSEALRAAARELQRLAQHMDDRRGAGSGSAPPPPAPPPGQGDGRP